MNFYMPFLIYLIKIKIKIKKIRIFILTSIIKLINFLG